jgi:hypothetical protein
MKYNIEKLEEKTKIWPPPIPKMPCFKCGILTNETQSIFGIGHYQCFMKNKINHKS